MYLGGITCFGAFSYGLVLVLRKLIFGYPPQGVATGWGSLITVVVFLGGLVLLFIGLVGEYIMNIFDSVHKFPGRHQRKIRYGGSLQLP